MTEHTKLGDVIRSLKNDGKSQAPPSAQKAIPSWLISLAETAAALTDAERAAKEVAADAREKLAEAMEAEGIKQVPLSDRPPVGFTTAKDKKKTLAALKEVTGFDWWSPERAQQVWDSLPVAEAKRLNMPVAKPPEPIE